MSAFSDAGREPAPTTADRSEQGHPDVDTNASVTYLVPQGRAAASGDHLQAAVTSSPAANKLVLTKEQRRCRTEKSSCGPPRRPPSAPSTPTRCRFSSGRPT